MSNIPKIIHQIWVGSPLPDWAREYHTRWRDLHPEWSVQLWYEEMLDWLDHHDLFSQWRYYAPRNRGQWQANIARIEILRRYGGVYVDSDMEPLRAIDDLIARADHNAFTVWSDEQRKIIGNAVCGSTPEHPLLNDLTNGLRVRVSKHNGLRPMYTCGVLYWTDEVRKRQQRDVNVFNHEVAYPYNFTELERGGEDFSATDAYMVHHWHNIRNGGNTGQQK